MDLNTIISNISTDEPRCCVYVAIGSAAHMVQQTSIGWSIEPRYEQQFPRFLRTLKTECPYDAVHIILIDPILEDPPFIVCNNKKQLSDKWCKVRDNVYHDDVCNITVYALRLTVKYEHNKCDVKDFIDITECFRLLNTLAIRYNWFVVLQDYSGNNIANAGTFFNQELQGHLDHIIYGLNVHSDEGCYLDISKPNCDFFYLIDDIQIKVSLSYDRETIQALESIGDQRYIILRDQRNTYLQDRKSVILNVLSYLRTLHNQTYSLPQSIKKQYKDILLNIETMSMYAQYETICHILRQELNSVGFSLSIVNNIIYSIHTVKDPYKWIDIILLSFKNIEEP